MRKQQDDERLISELHREVESCTLSDTQLRVNRSGVETKQVIQPQQVTRLYGRQQVLWHRRMSRRHKAKQSIQSEVRPRSNVR